jgi:hypothetical protein
VLRFAIWLLVIFMVVKIFRLFVNWKQYAGPDEDRSDTQPVIPPFDNVQDADFEDITPKPPPSGKDQPPA